MLASRLIDLLQEHIAQHGDTELHTQYRQYCQYCQSWCCGEEKVDPDIELEQLCSGLWAVI